MFKISVEELNKVLAVLGEVQAKLAYDAIKLLTNLEKLPEEIKEEVHG